MKEVSGSNNGYFDVTRAVEKEFFDLVMCLDTRKTQAFLSNQVYASDWPQVLNARSQNGKGPTPLEALKYDREDSIRVRAMIDLLASLGAIDFSRPSAVLLSDKNRPLSGAAEPSGPTSGTVVSLDKFRSLVQNRKGSVVSRYS